jgi:cellobiose phosphorylase
MQFFFGIGEQALMDLDRAKKQQADVLNALRCSGAVDRQMEKLDSWWEKRFSAFQCDIPDPAAMRQINTWNVVNVVQTGRYSRSVNTVAPGIRGIGFRDSCQDMLAIAPRDPAWAVQMFLYLLSQQYRDGHTVHYAYPEDGKPPTTSVHSDNHLWLPLVAYAIFAETGDADFLEQRIPFLAVDHLSTDGDGTVWEHLMASVKFTQTHLGQHGLPLTLHSDWNDIIGRFNRRAKGRRFLSASSLFLPFGS